MYKNVRMIGKRQAKLVSVYRKYSDALQIDNESKDRSVQIAVVWFKCQNSTKILSLIEPN